MLEAGEDGAMRAGIEIVLDLDDRGHRVLGLPEKLQTDRADMAGHAMQHPACRGDQAVAAFFLDARQTGQELVGDILAQTLLAKAGTRDLEQLGAHRLAAHDGIGTEPVGRIPVEAKARGGGVMDLAEVVTDAGDLEPVALRIDHAPPGEIVERRAPEHRLLAAGIHGDVAADAGGLKRGGIDRKDQPGGIGGFGHALGDHPGLGEDRGHRAIDFGQLLLRHGPDADELFGVDDRRHRRERNRAAGIAGAAAARNDGQPELDAAGHQLRNLRLGIGHQHDEGILDAPVGGIGHMRDPRHAIEADVVAGGDARQQPQRAGTQVGGLIEGGAKAVDRGMGEFEQAAHALGTHARPGAVGRLGIGFAAALDFGQTMSQRLDERRSPARIVEQVVLQEGVALHDPDIAQHLIEHARRAAGATFGAQRLDDVPGFGAEHPQHDLAVGERGVVVGNFAQTRVVLGCKAGDGQRDGRIHPRIVDRRPVPRLTAGTCDSGLGRPAPACQPPGTQPVMNGAANFIHQASGIQSSAPVKLT